MRALIDEVYGLMTAGSGCCFTLDKIEVERVLGVQLNGGCYGYLFDYNFNLGMIHLPKDNTQEKE